MRQNFIAVAADGIEVHHDYLDILREHADELAAQGIEYEEHDRRADPLTLSLLVSIVVTTTLATVVSEVIKKIIQKLSDRAKENPSLTIINLEINQTTFVLPQDRQKAADEVDRLTLN